jgi:small subunit ribosomal protein S16
MSVKIRLSRRGAKKRPFYDIVAIDSRKKRDGQPIEKLGYFNPMVTVETDQCKKVVLLHDLIKKWLSNGAIPSETVAKKLSEAGYKGLEKFLPTKNSQDIGVSKKERSKIKAEQLELAKQKAKKKAELAKQATKD